MKEPAALHASDVSQQIEDLKSVEGAPPSVDDHTSTEEVDGELRSLVDGIAMLGRFEAQLAEFEATLGEPIARGS